MPRRKTAAEDPEPNQPRGEFLPPIEDFVRKLSGVFSAEMKTPEGPVTEDEDDKSEDEDDDA